jgi:hypothetical protein
VSKHRHHIIPRHLGGGDEEENLTPPVSIQIHAEFHRQLYEEMGLKEDLIAWKALSGRITGEQARLEAALEGQRKSDKYKNRSFKDHLDSVRTEESCSKGGQTSSVLLVKWIQDNKEVHKRTCSNNGRASVTKREVRHEYLGTVYRSKRSLQDHTGLSNTGFYSYLNKGKITRLGKLIELEA